MQKLRVKFHYKLILYLYMYIHWMAMEKAFEAAPA